VTQSEANFDFMDERTTGKATTDAIVTPFNRCAPDTQTLEKRKESMQILVAKRSRDYSSQADRNNTNENEGIYSS
jgi:hypothetical protein